MRKKTVKFCADTIFWYLLYFLPVIAYLIYMLCEPGSGGTIVEFSNFMENSGFSILSNNYIYTLLLGLFGATGIFPVFANAGILSYFCYFIFVYIIHVLIDILLFLPRLAHKWLDYYTKEE